jgi:hypothetical protein
VADHVDVVTPVAPMDVKDLVRVGLAAERAGWTPAEGFEAAVCLRCHGTAPAAAVAMFQHAERWVQ